MIIGVDVQITRGHRPLFYVRSGNIKVRTTVRPKVTAFYVNIRHAPHVDEFGTGHASSRSTFTSIGTRDYSKQPSVAM